MIANLRSDLHLLLLIVLFRLGADASKGTGTNHKSAGRIIGGRVVLGKSEYPFVVSIQRSSSDGWEHRCGGSIVSTKAVLTACHCVVAGSSWDPPKLMDPSMARVVAGVVNLSEESKDKQVKQVEKVEAHPKCGNKPYYLSYDVGVYILKDPLAFTSHVQPLRISSHLKNIAIKNLTVLAKKGATCFSPGWGTTKSPGYFPSKVMKVATVRLFTTEQCQRFFCENAQNYCDTDFYDAKQICAAGTDSSDCNGDSGGPLICNGYVFGTVSWKIECEFGWPHVFTNIIPALDIINKYASGDKAIQRVHGMVLADGRYRRSGWN